MPLPTNPDCADLCAIALMQAKRLAPGGLYREDIAKVLRPLILKREQEVVQAALAVGGVSKPKKARTPVSKAMPPHPDDVTAYSLERGYPLDGARWCDYYASKGWIVSGRARMVDWKAAVRNWQANGWGQEGPHPIALKKLPPKPADPRYAPEPKGDWRKTALRILNVEELPETWTSWGAVPQEYRGQIVTVHIP